MTTVLAWVGGIVGLLVVFAVGAFFVLSQIDFSK